LGAKINTILASHCTGQNRIDLCDDATTPTSVRSGHSMSMDSTYLLGIDGGGTGCRARLTDHQGSVLGEGSAGPANLTLGIDIAVQSLIAATHEALAQAGLPPEILAQTHAGLGMAAGNVPRHRAALEATPLPFLSAGVRSDAEVACLGAHGGEEGGILILGTGSQGVVYRDHQFITVGGWGFALSDTGSGAILGRAAVRRAFLAHECVEPTSPLTMVIVDRFFGDREVMLDWSTNARPKDWAVFARTVFEYAKQGDTVALKLVRENAHAVERILDRMLSLGTRRIALMGGIATPTRPYLAQRFAPILVEPVGDAMDGALVLARQAAEAVKPG
jgi:glucosamine kinase